MTTSGALPTRRGPPPGEEDADAAAVEEEGEEEEGRVNFILTVREVSVSRFLSLGGKI